MRLLLDVSAVPARPVGAGVYTIAMARGLGARPDVDLHLLTRRSDTTRWNDIAPGAEVHASAPDGRPARLVWEQVAGPKVARAIRPDVWHAPHYTMPLRSPVPTVVAMHDLTFFEHPEWHERSKVVYFRRMMAAAARRADVIVTGSHDAATGLRSRVRPRGEIVVVHHGVDHDRFARRDDPQSVAAETTAKPATTEAVTASESAEAVAATKTSTTAKAAIEIVREVAPVTQVVDVAETFSPGEAVPFFPGSVGGAEWNSPSYVPQTNLILVGEVDWCDTVTPKTVDELRSVKVGQPWAGMWTWNRSGYSEG